jgi:mono/diheme cytochrome c family protein
MPKNHHKAAAVLLAGLVAAGATFAAGPEEELVRRGSSVFATRCAVCHGVDADGGSKLAPLMPVKPANLRVSRLSDEERRRIVTEGGASVGRSPNMPAWGGELSRSELAAVLAFAASIAPPPRYAAAP